MDEHGYVRWFHDLVYRPIHISELDDEEDDDMERNRIEWNLEWMKEYKYPHDVCTAGKAGDYEVLPYTNIHILIDKAMRDKRDIGYVTYGVEVHLKQQMNWLSRLYKGAKLEYDTPEDRDRFDSIMKSIEVYTDFLSFVIEKLGKE